MGCDFISNMCLDSIDGNGGGVLFEILLVVYCFMGLATICDDYLVMSLEVLCQRWNVREDIAGATFMAFGSAAPEIVVNAVSTLKGITDTGVGAIIGSGYIAFMFIPGVCALYAAENLEIKRRPMFRDQLFYTIALIQLCAYFHDGVIQLYEAFLLVITYVIYLVVVAVAPIIRQKWRESQGEKITRQKSFVEKMKEQKESLLDAADPDAEIGEDGVSAAVNASLNVNEPGDDDFDDPNESKFMKSLREGGRIAYLPLRFVFKWTCPPCEEGSEYEYLYPVTFMVSFAWVAVFSFVISTVVERWAELSGVQGGFFGLFLISIGAEIPDTIQSVTVAKRGYGSMAVANSIGSQIINICLGLGFPWLIANAAGMAVLIPSHRDLQIAAFFQGGAVIFSFAMFLGAAIYYKLPKALLNRAKGWALVNAYWVVLVCYAAVYFATNHA